MNKDKEEAIYEAAISDEIKSLNTDNGEIERIITENADLLADLWVLNHKTPLKATRLIQQQLEHIIICDAEINV